MTKHKSTKQSEQEKAGDVPFTPGPWFYERASGYSGFFIARRTPASGSGLTGIASTYGHTDDRETEANARLIAAVPALYDVVDRAQARWDDLPNFLRQNASKVLAEMMDETLKELRDALTLADGFEWHGRRDEKGGA